MRRSTTTATYSGFDLSLIVDFVTWKSDDRRRAAITAAAESNAELRELIDEVREIWDLGEATDEAPDKVTGDMLEARAANAVAEPGHPPDDETTSVRGVHQATYSNAVAKLNEAERFESSGKVTEAVELRSRAADLLKTYCESLPKDSPLHEEVGDRLANTLFAARRYEECEKVIAGLERVLSPEQLQPLAELRLGAKVVLEFFEYLKEISKRVRRRSWRRLRNDMAEFMDRIQAASAWLYLPRGDGYSALIEINGGIRRDLKRGEGMVGRCAELKEIYYAPDVSLDPYYVEAVGDIRSAVSVPVIYEGMLLAIAHFESNVFNGFSNGQIWELKTLVGTFVPNLLILRDADPNRICTAGWHFDRRGWGLSDVLNEFCFILCELIAKHAKSHARPACAVWNYDEFKNEAWVRAGDGYDAEFIMDRRILRARESSLVGRMSAGTRGTVYSGSWQDAPIFQEKTKAGRMGLHQIMVTPVCLPGGTSVGTLNLYGFQQPIQLPKAVFQHLADMVGELIAGHETLRPRVAASKFAHEMLQGRTLSVEESFTLALRKLLDFHKADAGSIFIMDDSGDVLTCVATSGLECDGRKVLDCRDATYDLRKDVGFTTFLAQNPGACVRKNDLFNTDEPILGRGFGESPLTALPQNKYREKLSLSTVDHRRFLGISLVCPHTGKTLGVIRLLRSPHSRPFLQADESMLRALSATMHKMFYEWRKEIELTKHYRADALRLTDDESRTDQERMRALGRSIRPVPAGFGAHRHLVEEVLQNALVYFRPYGAILGSLREVVEHPTHGKEMRLLEIHSVRTNSIPNPMEFPQPNPTQGSVGWKCLGDWKLLTFVAHKCPQLHRPIHPDSQFVRAGACVPFASWTRGRCVNWVFSLDCDREVAWRPRDIEVLLHMSRKLSAILSDATSPILRPEAELLKGFVASGARATAADWAMLHLNIVAQGTGRRACDSKHLLARLGEVQSPPTDSWASAHGDAGIFGVRVHKDNLGICSIPLHFGTYNAGYFTCGSNRRNYSHLEDEAIGGIARLWAGLTGFPGTGTKPWEAKFTSRRDEYVDGISVWEAMPCYSAPFLQTVKQPLVAQLSDADLIGSWSTAL